MKKQFILYGMSALLCGLVILSACGPTQTNIDSNTGGEDDYQVIITLSETELALDIKTGGVELSAQINEPDAPISWSVTEGDAVTLSATEGERITVNPAVPGTAVITASWESIAAECTVTVTDSYVYTVRVGESEYVDTYSNVIPISTAEEFLNEVLVSNTTDTFVLQNDIDFEGVEIPAASKIVFTATFDGNGHTMSNMDYRPSGNVFGVFGEIRGILRNVNFVDCSVVAGDSNVGFLGGIGNGGLVENIYFEGYCDGGEQNDIYGRGVAPIRSVGPKNGGATMRNCIFVTEGAKQFYRAAIFSDRAAAEDGTKDCNIDNVIAVSSTATDYSYYSLNGAIYNSALYTAMAEALASGLAARFENGWLFEKE